MNLRVIGPGEGDGYQEDSLDGEPLTVDELRQLQSFLQEQGCPRDRAMQILAFEDPDGEHLDHVVDDLEQQALNYKNAA